VIGQIIHYRRKELGLTQEALCEGICSITYISKVENNVIKPKEDILFLLCERLNLEQSELEEVDEEEVTDLLKRTYKAIVNRDNLSVIEQMIKSLAKYIIKIKNPQINVGYYLIELHYYLYKRDKKNALIKMELIKDNKRYMNRKLEIWYYKAFGLYEYLFGSIGDSLNYYREAERIMLSANKEDVDLYYQMGLVYAKLMKIEDSLEFIMKALKIYNIKLNLKRIVDCNMMIGINYNRIGKYDSAVNQFLNIVALPEGSIDKLTLRKVYHNLGYSYCLNGDTKNAVEYLNKSLAIGERSKQISTLYVLAYVKKKESNINEALKIINEGIKYSQIENNISYYYKFKIIEYYTADNIKIDNIIHIVEKEALPFFKKQNPFLFDELVLILANLYKEIRMYKKSTFYYEVYINSNFKNKTREFLH
jgi:HTH-type transcriptional regulator, quorum sensing regulator NprR